jgi:hypothetical protein
MPLGVTWSKRLSIHRGIYSGGVDRIKAAGSKFKYRAHLLPCEVELFDDFLYGGSGFEVFEDCGHGHPGIAKHSEFGPSLYR